MCSKLRSQFVDHRIASFYCLFRVFFFYCDFFAWLCIYVFNDFYQHLFFSCPAELNMTLKWIWAVGKMSQETCNLSPFRQIDIDIGQKVTLWHWWQFLRKYNIDEMIHSQRVRQPIFATSALYLLGCFLVSFDCNFLFLVVRS